jgi:hypothetical protein
VLTRTPAYLTGYFQSEKYFQDIAEKVREAFVFSNHIMEGLLPKDKQRILQYQQRIENTTAISIHIRRGDYIENHQVYGGICTELYYKKAIELMKAKYPDAFFFIFSNEPEWAEKWIQNTYNGENNFVIIEGSTEAEGYLDMYLMSKCKHHIIANSSFSWWGAWLNPNQDKTVIAPDKWMNNKDMKDIYTETMIQISKEGVLNQKTY